MEEEDKVAAQKLVEQFEAAEEKLKEAKEAQKSCQKAVDFSERRNDKKSEKDR